MQTTRRQIIEYLKKKRRATVNELAQHLGLSPMGVRQHLMVLEHQDLVGSTEVRRGTGGRPHAVYSLTDLGNEVFPKRYHQLADTVLEVLEVLEGEEKVNQVLEKVAEKWATPYSSRLANLPLDETMTEFARLMAEDGRPINLEKVEDGYYFYALFCPFHRVAQKHHEMCKMDTHFLSKALGHEVEMIGCEIRGNDSCAFFVSADGIATRVGK